MSTFKLYFVLLVTCLSSFVIFMTQAAETGDPNWRQQQVKIVYNLSKFVDWPDTTFVDKNSAFHFCLLGEDPFQTALEDLVNKPLRGHPIQFHAFTEVTQLGNDECQVLFISQSIADHLATVLTQLAQRPILTVSDIPQFAEQGGVIGLIPTEGRVHFEINLAAAHHQQLSIRAPLLQMASIVQKLPE